MRRLQKVSTEAVCRYLEISLSRYGEYILAPDSAPQKLVVEYQVFLGTQENNMGVNHLIKIQQIVKSRGINEKEFWQSLEKTYSQVCDQIARERSISFDQIARAYGQLGYEVVARDVSRTKEISLPCNEFERFKDLEHKRNDKQRKL